MPIKIKINNNASTLCWCSPLGGNWIFPALNGQLAEGLKQTGKRFIQKGKPNWSTNGRGHFEDCVQSLAVSMQRPRVDIATSAWPLPQSKMCKPKATQTIQLFIYS